MGISGTTITTTHTATITKPIPSSDEDDEGADKEIDGTVDPETVPDIKVLSNDTFTLLIRQDDHGAITAGGMDVFVPEGLNVVMAYDEDYTEIVSKSSTTGGEDVYAIPHEKFIERIPKEIMGQIIWIDVAKSVTLYIKIGDIGRQQLRWKLQAAPSTEWASLVEVEPREENLSIPNMTLLQLNEEELDRLGDGYSYILQSNLQLNTSEEYVRDWYKNFRIGVFNNRIESNCTTYYQYNNTETEFDGYFILPGIYDLTDASLRFDVDHPISLTILEDTYDITSTETIDLFEEYRIPVTFTKDTTDNE